MTRTTEGIPSEQDLTPTAKPAALPAVTERTLGPLDYATMENRLAAAVETTRPARPETPGHLDAHALRAMGFNPDTFIVTGYEPVGFMATDTILDHRGMRFHARLDPHLHGDEGPYLRRYVPCTHCGKQHPTRLKVRSARHLQTLQIIQPDPLLTRRPFRRATLPCGGAPRRR